MRSLIERVGELGSARVREAQDFSAGRIASLRILLRDSIEFLRWRFAVVIFLDVTGSAIAALGFAQLMTLLLAGRTAPAASVSGALLQALSGDSAWFTAPVLIILGATLVFLRQFWATRLSISYEEFSYQRLLSHLRRITTPSNDKPDINTLVVFSTKSIRNTGRAMLRLIEIFSSAIHFFIFGAAIIYVFRGFAVALFLFGLVALPAVAYILLRAWSSGRDIAEAARHSTLEKRREILDVLGTSENAKPTSQGTPPDDDDGFRAGRFTTDAFLRGYYFRLLLPHALTWIFGLIFAIGVLAIFIAVPDLVSTGADAALVILAFVLLRICWSSLRSMINSLIGILALLPTFEAYLASLGNGPSAEADLAGQATRWTGEEHDDEL